MRNHPTIDLVDGITVVLEVSLTSSPSSLVHAPRARLGPTKGSNHVGQRLYQRPGHRPGLPTLLAAQCICELHQAAPSIHRHGISILIVTRLIILYHSILLLLLRLHLLLPRRCWTASPPHHHIPLLTIHYRQRTLPLSGLNLASPQPRPTGTLTYMTCPSHCPRPRH